MEKRFQEWHQQKASIHDQESRVFFHEREIWWCALGANVGFEQDGKGDRFARPVLILKKFNKEIAWALPLSRRLKSGPFYISFVARDGFTRTALLSHLRLLDAKRLLDKMDVVPKEEFRKIQKAVRDLCDH